MRGTPPKYRTVVAEALFTEQLEKLFGDAREARDFMEGPEALLSFDPFYGAHTFKGSAVWFLGTDETPGWPALNIYYTFDDDDVWLLTIEKAKASE